MKITILEYLECPLCHGILFLKSTKKTKNEIFEGKLTCKKCKEIFPIKKGIPRFVKDTAKDFVKTEDSFSAKWKKHHVNHQAKEWIDFQHNSPAKKMPFKTPNTKPTSNIVSNLKSELLPTQMTVFTQSEQFTPKESYSSFLNNQPTTQMAIDYVKKIIEALATETNFVHEEKII